MIDFNKYYPVNDAADLHGTTLEELDKEITTTSFSLEEKIRFIRGENNRWKAHKETRLYRLIMEVKRKYCK